MVTRVNGGVFDDQVLTGSMCHYSVTGADFSGAYSDGSIEIPDGAGPNIPFIIGAGSPVPGSAAEIILLNIEVKATVVIMNPDEGGTGLYFAIENTDNGWTNLFDPCGAAQIQAMIRSFGTDVGVDHVDCSSVVVESVPYILGAGTMGAETFLELIDTPSTYMGAAGYTVVVNAGATGLEFVPSAGGGGGEVNTGANIGSGEGVFALKNGLVLEFKSLIGGNNVTLSSTANEITIDMDQLSSDDILNNSTVTGATTVTDALNLLDTRVNTNTTDILNLQNSVANLAISDLTDVDTTGVTDGQILVWNNLAGEWQPAAAPIGDVVSVFGRTGVVIAQNGDYDSDQVTNNSSVLGLTVSDALDNINNAGYVTDGANVGVGTAEVFRDEVAGVLNFKTLGQGTYITLGGDADNILISSTAEPNTASNLTGDEGIFFQKTGVDLEFKSLTAGTNITLSSTDDAITINSTASGGSTTFVGLTDTPADYTGAADQFVKVNAGGTALEFADVVVDAANVTVDASGFTGNLDSGDTDVQTALETLDQINTEFNYIVVSATSTLPSANSKYMVVTDGITVTLPSYSGLSQADNIRIAKTADIIFDIEANTGEDILLENGNTVSSVSNNKGRELLFMYDGTQWSMLI